MKKKIIILTIALCLAMALAVMPLSGCFFGCGGGGCGILSCSSDVDDNNGSPDGNASAATANAVATDANALIKPMYDTGIAPVSDTDDIAIYMYFKYVHDNSDFFNAFTARKNADEPFYLIATNLSDSSAITLDRSNLLAVTTQTIQFMYGPQYVDVPFYNFLQDAGFFEDYQKWVPVNSHLELVYNVILSETTTVAYQRISTSPMGVYGLSSTPTPDVDNDCDDDCMDDCCYNNDTDTTWWMNLWNNTHIPRWLMILLAVLKFIGALFVIGKIISLFTKKRKTTRG